MTGVQTCALPIFYPTPPPPGLVPSCAEAGVLGAITGIIGSIQATEVFKQILGIGEPLVNRLLLVDALGLITEKHVVADIMVTRQITAGHG